MDIFTSLTLLINIVSVLVLSTTIPHQIREIWHESDKRYRKVCWIILFGTICLILISGMQLLMPLFYGGSNERIYYNLVSSFNAAIGVVLGVLAHVLYKSTDKTLPRTIEDIEKDDRP